MKKIYSICAVVILICVATLVKAETYMVSSQSFFDTAQNDASVNDTIIWMSGTYSDIFMEIDKSNLFITAEVLGDVIFTGDSKVNITSDYVTLKGVQFMNGDIGTSDVINTYGSYNLFTHLNIENYRSYKYLRIREASQYVTVSYCNFENRLNLDDQNILSILVDENNPGYHKVRFCSFKNFQGTGNDMGIEPIRIGLSTQADRISRSLVEYCYFTQCDGDGELISSKAAQNVYRFNTFENNTKAELVLRHGSEAVVYGNFFLNGKGGVRVREGQDHYIFNNYFYELDDRAIYLQNDPSDPLDNITIAFNTIVDCSEIILGSIGDNQPSNVLFANNIFTDPDDALFEQPTGNETWVGNLAFGNLGMPAPVGVTVVNPMLGLNAEGYFELTSGSPALNAALEGYSDMPDFIGIDEIDTNVRFDLMRQLRPGLISNKDVGCSEFPHHISIRPIATESNTGPIYKFPTLNCGGCSADFNDDGNISAFDLSSFLGVFGTPCP